jgi:hypothetical protein
MRRRSLRDASHEATRLPPPARPVGGEAPLALRVTVTALAGVLLVSLGGLLVVHLRPRGTPVASSPDRRPVGASRSPVTSRSAARTAATAPAASDAPRITALTPPVGRPGQVVTVTGSRLFSANGTIVVTFDGRVTQTSCPNEAHCVASVPPPLGSASSAVVQVRTTSGTYNTLRFAYA